ncbi:MAG TPA: HIT family protein [Spirochaetales bacterium]|nr:HIT family protein [Spirochaetales bacterium]HRY56398.1 HIT family protein [Spirochaetia bacterium]HRZ64956.1 HIT family protein [Spirochaetia bacterium]
MKHDPACFYCVPEKRPAELALEIADLEVSTLFLFKEQSHPGRCILAYKEHARELYELPPEDLAAFGRDLARASKAVAGAVKPAKLNYGAFGDKMGHLHFHIVPKLEGGRSWGGMFDMMPEPKKLAPEAELAALAAAIKAGL